MTQQVLDDVQTHSEVEEQFVVMLRKMPPEMRAEFAADVVSISLAAMTSEDSGVPL